MVQGSGLWSCVLVVQIVRVYLYVRGGGCAHRENSPRVFQHT